MRAALCGGLVLAACAASVVAAGRESLYPRTHSAPSGVVVVRTEREYARWIREHDRDFALAVLYTTTAPGIHCPACTLAVSEFRTAAASLLVSAGWAGNLSAAATPAGAAAEGDILFVPPTDAQHDATPAYWLLVDHALVPNVLIKHQFNTVPQFAVFGAGLSAKERKAIDAGGALPTSVMRNTGETLPDAADYLRFVVGDQHHVAVLRPAKERAPLAAAVAIAVALLAALLPAWRPACEVSTGAPVKPAFYRQPWVWMVGAMALYGVAISGVIGCIIRVSPLVSRTSKGVVSVFVDSNDSQTVMEGTLMGVLSLLLSLSVISLFIVARSRSLSLFAKSLLIAFAAALALTLLYVYVVLYARKTRWYQVQAIIPASLVRTVSMAWRRGVRYAQPYLDAAAATVAPAWATLLRAAGHT